MAKIKSGELVLLLSKEHSYLVRAEARPFHSSVGIVDMTSLIGKEYGHKILTHTGSGFFAVEPGTNDLLNKKLKRLPATIHQKDIGFILGMTGLSAKARVVEAGTGSGHATYVLASHCSKVFSYEIREDFHKHVKQSFDELCVKNAVLKNQDVLEGISEKGVDMVLLDMQGAEKAVPLAFKALMPGGYLVVYSPYVEQVKLVVAEIEKLEFTEPITSETILREWDVREHTLPKRAGMMHTAFITIARKV
jgi:tRNA (adenine57-N1/adenine58-N1)-methyltransferase